MGLGRVVCRFRRVVVSGERAPSAFGTEEASRLPALSERSFFESQIPHTAG